MKIASIDWEETDRKPCGRMNKEESVTGHTFAQHGILRNPVFPTECTKIA